MIHQPLGSFQGQATDFDIQAREILSIRSKLNQILSKNTGQTIKKIQADTERDNFMQADEAKKYGLMRPNTRIQRVSFIQFDLSRFPSILIL